MIRHIKILNLFLISLVFIISFSSCSGKTLKIEWVLIGDIPVTEKMEIGIRTKNKTIQEKSLSIGKTESIQVNENESISSLEHDSSFCVMIKQNKNSDLMEIYVYPSWNYIENENSYIIEPVDMNVYYYMEFFDEAVGKNYLLISKDNVIDKRAIMNKIDGNLDKLLNSIDLDFAYYNNDEQPLAMPYNGYIIKSQNFEKYVFLSTLWGSLTFLP